MKFIALALVAFVAAVAAQEDLVKQLPSCAVPCLGTAGEAAGCGEHDWHCICGPGAAIIRKVATPCVMTACSPMDGLKTKAVATKICSSLSATWFA